MPRSVKLSWQAAAEGSGRAGRWRKKYKGKVYYYPGGRGKSDREAYEAAVAAWEADKLKIDRDAPRPHQRDHESATTQWEGVLSWCYRHGDHERAEIAAKKLENLRKRLAAPILRKLDREDWYESWFDRRSIEQDPIAQTVLEQMERDLGQDRSPPVNLSSIKPFVDWQDGSPRRIEKEIWRDRLDNQKREAASEDDRLETHVHKYVGRKEKFGSAGEISVGRVRATGIHLAQFQDWLGKDFDVAKIDEEILEGFHGHLLDKVASATWSATTASDCMVSVKSFVRWMWSKKAIANLPRNLDKYCKDLRISKSKRKIMTFTLEEIKTLLTGASDRTRLYILLMLNCGMTQKDVADLDVFEVDWDAGRIKRKRSKTSDEENVPEVDYLLWPETIRLLRQERDAKSSDRVLLNSNGSPIWSEKLGDDGKYYKTDNVKNAFDRLRKTKGIHKPLISLKKTSASLLRNNKEFRGVENLFLGHAPRTMADKSYAEVYKELLDPAVTWLGQTYGLVAPAVASKADESAAKPSDSAPPTESGRGDQAPKRQCTTRSHRSGRRSKAAHSRSNAAEPAEVTRARHKPRRRIRTVMPRPPASNP